LPPVKIHTVYVGRPRAAWPKPAFDPKAEIAKFEKILDDVRSKLGDVEFVGGELVGTPEEAARLADSLKDADAVLMFHLTLGVLPAMQRIVEAGRATAVYSQPFSGHEWMFVRQWQKEGKRLIQLATSDAGELVEAAALLRVPARMARSRILVVGRPDGTEPATSKEKVKQSLGTDVVPVSVERLVEAHRAVDGKLAEAEADSFWIGPARKVVEPSRDEIVKSARMYFAMQNLLEEERAQAITVRCLGGIPIDVLGYPCLGFSKLLDGGLVGACEADMDSTLTMLMFGYAFGVPGFITDPLFDTSRSAVIHAHCTAPTRMDGKEGERAPFTIRTHTDDDKGAALEVEMRVGQPITCAKLVNLDTMILSTGKIVEVPDFDDRGCRTQIVTEVADAQKMLDNWGNDLLTGWMPQLHRVVFYGDHARGTRRLCALMGFKVFEGM
jgi:L-fucose isomerase-like protein